jgi:hypothetical protein
MSLEDRLTGWTAPSSATEQDKQDRTERMIREAVAEHKPFSECSLRVYAKGSYANNTNVKADSDVDIVVECGDAEYWEEEAAGLHPSRADYLGKWTPQNLRAELGRALEGKFAKQVDHTGTTAITVHSGTSRVDADVVPSFSFTRYMKGGDDRPGTKIFRSDGVGVVNYPAQQLANGRAKNARTNAAFKKCVRILKRAENAMAEGGVHPAVPSYLIECLVYNCPDRLFAFSTWTEIVREVLVHMWHELQGDEPQEPGRRWVEVNQCLYLFHPGQKWTRGSARGFVQAAWNFLGLK